VLIDVYFDDDRPAIVLSRDLFNSRRERFAGASPGSKKIDQHRFATGNQVIKLCIARMDYLAVRIRLLGLVGIHRGGGLLAANHQGQHEETDPGTILHSVNSRSFEDSNNRFSPLTLYSIERKRD